MYKRQGFYSLYRGSLPFRHRRHAGLDSLYALCDLHAALGADCRGICQQGYAEDPEPGNRRNPGNSGDCGDGVFYVILKAEYELSLIHIFQLCLTVQGTVLWSTESCRSTVPEGEAVFINSQRTHRAGAQGEEAAFFCVNFPPDLICPIREGSLYENSVLPVLQSPALNRKVIDRHTVQGKEILALLTEMAGSFEAKEEGYELELMGNVFKIWKWMRALLEEELICQPQRADRCV